MKDNQSNRGMDYWSNNQIEGFIKQCKDEIWKLEDEILNLELKKLIHKKNLQVANEELDERSGKKCLKSKFVSVL